MEIAWLVVVILVLVAAALGWQWLNARNAAAGSHAEVEQAAQRARDAETRLESAERNAQAARGEADRLRAELGKLESARDAGGFDGDRVYKLLAKSTLESAEAEGTYGVVQEDTGAVRSFLVEESLDHLDPGDCFGVLRGKLAKLSESDFQVGTQRQAAAEPAAETATAAVTEVRSAVEAEPPAAEDAQKTALYVAPAVEEPEDPGKGLPHLVVEREDGSSESHPLPFQGLSVGRGPDNDIVLNDDMASRVHFTVSYTGHRFLLEDNQSTNGTRCNDKEIASKPLEFGDRIQVGGTTLTFSCEGYDLKDQDPERAVAALEESVERQPDFIDALKLLAFMLERNVRRRKEAASHWERIAQLEKSP